MKCLIYENLFVKRRIGILRKLKCKTKNILLLIRKNLTCIKYVCFSNKKLPS